MHIIPTLGLGGAEKLLVETVQSLKDYRHVVVIFRKTSPELHCASKVHVLDVSIPIQFFKALTKLKRIINTEKPEIIHSHLYWPIILMRLCRLSKAVQFQWYHNDIYNPQNTSQYSFKRLQIDRLTNRKELHSVFVSQFLLEKIAPKIRANQNLHVIHNFVDDDFFAIAKHKSNDVNELRILAVANLKPQKNQIVLIKALAMLKDQNFVCDIVGEGEQRENLEKSIAEEKLNGITLHGLQKDVLPFYEIADVFVMPSLHEGFGISLVEAMASGVPCIVSDISVLREVGGEAVCYFQPNNPQELASKLINMQDIKIRRYWSDKALERSKIYRKKEYYEKLNCIYKLA